MKRKQTRRAASLRRDSARGVAGEEHAAYPCPALPFSGCLIEHEHENDDEHDQITIRRRYSWRGAQWAGGCGLSRAGGTQRTPLGKNDYIGGATTSQKVFPDYEARLSRYSYLVSLFPEKIIRDLGLNLELRTARDWIVHPVREERSPRRLAPKQCLQGGGSKVDASI